MKPNPIHIPRSFEVRPSGFSLSQAAQSVSKSELDAAAAKLGAEMSEAVDHRVFEMMSGESNSTTSADATTSYLTDRDLVKTMERISKIPTPPRIVAVTTRPDHTGPLRAAVAKEREQSVASIFPLLEFPITELARQTEPFLVFDKMKDYLRHVALMTFEVGDVVMSINPGFWLRSGCYSYDDAVVASLDPFLLISREGDMSWSATILPEWFQRVGRAGDETMKRVLARLEREKNASRL